MKLNTEKRSNKKRERGITKQEKEKRKKAETLLVEEITPIVAFDEELGVGIMEDGSLCDCFQIVTKDLNSLSRDQLLRDALTWDKLYKTYAGDLKEVFFSYPTETEQQQRYVEHKLRTTENPIYRKFLIQRLRELQNAHTLYLTRGSALFFFAKNPTEYKSNYIAVYTTLTRTNQPLIRKMSNERKKQIFFRLYNKNLKK